MVRLNAVGAGKPGFRCLERSITQAVAMWTLARQRFAILRPAPSTRSRPVWIPVQLKDDSRVWISAIVKSRVNETGGINGTMDPLVNITTNGHAKGIVMMDNVTSSGWMLRIPATARDVKFSP